MVLILKNLEKKKLFLKYNILIKKNINLLLINDGCYLKKFIFFFTKKIKKNQIIIINKKKFIKINTKSFFFFNYSLIKFSKKIKIKNKKIKKICNCNVSFNI